MLDFMFKFFSPVIENFSFLLKALNLTLFLSIFSIIFSLIFGTILGVLRYSRVPLISQICGLFIDLTRSIPLILYIVFIHYTFSPFLPENFLSFPFFEASPIELKTGLISLILFTCAYIAEIVRSAMSSIDRHQIWDAKSLGLSSFQTLVYIVLPIVFIKSLPSLIVQFASCIKDTSLVSFIGLIELTRAGEIVCEITHKEVQVLGFVALVYFILCFILTKISKILVKKYNFINNTNSN